MRLKPKELTLGSKITILAFVLVLSATISAIVVFVGNLSTKLEEELGNRALAIARTVAEIPEIQENVGNEDGHTTIQPIAERIRVATQSEYIVILDMHRTRYSHPLRDRIGGTFTGVDGRDAFLEAEEIVSRGEGIAGPSVRAFAPIMIDEGTTQAGVVLVGILSPSLMALLSAMGHDISLSLLAGLLAGIAGSFILATNIKRNMFDLEPGEIARMLEERTSVFHSIEEGIIAISQDNRITVINNIARRIFGIKKDVHNQNIEKVIPDSRLPHTSQTGIPEYNRERNINNTTILVNRIPIWVRGKVVGAVATFRDKTEVHRLAEELTGVKNFIDALRVQNHENINKLHTIAGLIQLDKEEEALDYIFQEIEKQQELTSFLTENIKDYSIAGLLLGKYSRAQELKIQLDIDRQSRLHQLPKHMDSSALIAVIGNLLENAFDAVNSLSNGEKRVSFSMRDENERLLLEVTDTGNGIPPEIRNKIFQKGFSTKDEKERGLGLALVYSYISNAGGNIDIDSAEGQGTKITIEVPL